MSDRAGFVDEDEELQEVQRLLERRQELMQVLDRQMREQAETIKREVIERKQRGERRWRRGRGRRLFDANAARWSQRWLATRGGTRSRRSLRAKGGARDR